jgi:abhydrolase domain-containing protein 13
MMRQSSSGPKIPTIVFFHGNAGNIGLRLPNALQMLQYLGANVLLVEYRGYGDSDDAQINEAGLKLDSEAALQFIRTHPQVDPNQIFIFGRSLGGSVAFHLAQYAERKGIPIAGVIVENTFLSIAAMVDTLMPYVAPFKALILRIGWRSELIVPHLTVPILYLAGARDELVPHSHMLELYKKSSQSRYSKCTLLRMEHTMKVGCRAVRNTGWSSKILWNVPLPCKREVIPLLQTHPDLPIRHPIQ